jgi:hypothetical protein
MQLSDSWWWTRNARNMKSFQNKKPGHSDIVGYLHMLYMMHVTMNLKLIQVIVDSKKNLLQNVNF